MPTLASKWSDANVVCDALRRQAEANHEQAVANRATAQAILAHAQRRGYSDKTTDIVPDMLESRYLSDDDAMGDASIAGKYAKYASNACQDSARCALGTKRVVPSVLELLSASGKARTPLPRGATENAVAEQVAVEGTDADKAAAEVHVTTAPKPHTFTRIGTVEPCLVALTLNSCDAPERPSNPKPSLLERDRAGSAGIAAGCEARDGGPSGDPPPLQEDAALDTCSSDGQADKEVARATDLERDHAGKGAQVMRRVVNHESEVSAETPRPCKRARPSTPSRMKVRPAKVLGGLPLPQPL